MKPRLENVTLCIVDCLNYGEAISAIRKSQYQCEFARTIFLTDCKITNSNFPFDIVQIPKISSKEEYSKFIIKELYKYVTTDFVLLIQHDGYVLNGGCWDNSFLSYDYIGAAWLYADGRNVGNGGFSLRSRKLLELVAKEDFALPMNPEDDVYCRLYRPYLEEKYGIKYAPEEVADKFSFELREPICPTFGFHGNFHNPYRPTVVIKRDAALGDCVAVEPLLDYYHKKGYHVVIDMPLHIAMIYANHHYTIKHITQLTDNRIPLEIIDLNGSYEAKPKQLHLQSYYETAGVKDGEIKNPKLNFPIGDHNRIFRKPYFILHIDNRSQPYRNAYGINWEAVVKKISEAGYLVIQVGLTEKEEVPGAIQFNTPTTNMLLYLCAGASGFVGVDSGVAAISVACNIQAAILFGSVDPKVIHPDLSNIHIIEHERPCETPKCWGDVENGTTGKECVVNKNLPPCTQYTTEMVINAVNKMLQ